MPKRIKFDVLLEEYQNISQLPVDSQDLLTQARDTCQYAYAPYSNFQVGAALLLDNGKIVRGSNQENAATPSGLCAERVALSAASSVHPSVTILKLAVTATKRGSLEYLAVTPCGACRQVISEYQTIQQKPIEIIMEGPQNTIMVASSIDMLLPFKFSATFMDSRDHEV
jgi:cytidine deaminase